MVASSLPTNTVNHAQNAIKKTAHFALPDIQGYYRSKLLLSPYKDNLFVAAASPLFSLIERLASSHSLPPLAGFREHIAHEIQAFVCRLQQENIQHQAQALAYYMLTCTIDEALGKAYTKLQGTTAQFLAFTPNHRTEFGEPGSIFFDVVQELEAQAESQYQLLEFAYHCLSSGFEGKLHQEMDGPRRRDEMLEAIYQQVKRTRPKALQIAFDNKKPEETPRDFKKILRKAIYMSLLLLTGSLSIAYLSMEQKTQVLALRHDVVNALG